MMEKASSWDESFLSHYRTLALVQNHARFFLGHYEPSIFARVSLKDKYHSIYSRKQLHAEAAAVCKHVFLEMFAT